MKILKLRFLNLNSLYGSTPRLKIISKSTNEIMSRKTWKCFAELTFEVKSGIYTCHWSQHRAHKSPDGNLLDSKHEISENESG
jgi:exonuclease SbcC